ncbi:iron complex transport system permease protein [Lishizhenia tianjinensis]|uniref:Iron complex transport system permease protein n=2 Tax=Lishizhenia TaxID=559293 RepID=A0A1I6YYH9_9FLAO|nr:iron ABC transporter permease [Lishizhenia tianjinensis]SFT55509.1 iron complex transport system permease protein [Lishizhenia tianjinensis]
MVLFFVDIFVGSTQLSWADLWNSIFNYDSSQTEQLLAHVFRIPKAITGVLAGAALAISGLLMQTLFQNPLAGPYVLGINSGSSLFVALSTMTGIGVFASDFGIITSALLGAFAFGLLILISSIYVRSKISLLLIGIMLGSFSGALINVVQSYSNPDALKAFTLWSFGSLNNVAFEQLWWFILVGLTGIILSLFLTKPLNLLVIGEENASLLGVNIKRTRLLIIFIAALLTGTVTALCGPIAFVGLAIPNIVKYIFKTSNHLFLILGSALMGAVLLLLCDLLIFAFSDIVQLPLNAITALFGAPIVVWIILKKY